MNVHRTPFACALLILIACALFPKVATAQYTAQYTDVQCTSVEHAITEAMEAEDWKRVIAVERQNLSYCTAYMQGNEYTGELGILASALNDDDQHEEALGAANQCLAINAGAFMCAYQKAKALGSLGRLSEAKSVVEQSLLLPAIAKNDAGYKELLQRLKVRLSALSSPGVPSSLPQNQNPSSRAEVPLKKDSGIFVVPVQINGAITLNFTIDSGAADVSVPADVFSTLRRTGTIGDADVTGEQTYVLADGSKAKSVTFTIRSLKVGDKVVENVRGSVTPAQGSLLLGQSFLERFKSWSFDNTNHQLRLEPQ
jgi:clan AA aspartic protease (TIGR02281 family)